MKRYETGEIMGETKAKYTVSEAIEAVEGLHKKRIYQMMNAQPSELSYESIEEPGRSRPRRLIDGAELARVFGSKFHPSETGRNVSETNMKRFKTYETERNAPGNHELTTKIQLLEERLEHKDELLRERERAITELREGRDAERREKDRLLGIVENQTRLLTHAQEQAVVAYTEPKRPWWKLW